MYVYDTLILYLFFFQMEVRVLLSHLLAKVLLVEKQNKQILGQIAKLQRKGEEQTEKRNGNRISWQLERRGTSRTKACDSEERGNREEKGGGGNKLHEVRHFHSC